jgi:hypothetical protein
MMQTKLHTYNIKKQFDIFWDHFAADSLQNSHITKDSS